jgi:hypothetical protein
VKTSACTVLGQRCLDISDGVSPIEDRQHFRAGWLEWNCHLFALVRARRAAVQRPVRPIRDGDKVVGAERVTAAVAVELIAARAQQGSARRMSAGLHRDQGISAVFVALNWNAVKEGVAGGAGGGSES